MFNTFSNAVRKQFDSVSEEYLFVVDAPDLWTHYLNSFPEGSNPLFRKRTEYDCACCRSFLRNIGNVVAIQNGAMVSVWDIQGLPEPFQTVANSMAEYIKSRRISDIFITKERFYGSGRTITLIEEKTHFFDHFSVVVPAQFVSKRENGEKRGFARTTRDVLYRGLTELNPVAVEDVINLIKENAIYRGAEHLSKCL